jgi:PadR family transcriptional regulator PadR
MLSLSARITLTRYRGVAQTNLLQGTLDLLILKTLSLDPLHGLGVARRIEQMTQGTFLVKPGSLFPALHRMERSGWVSSEFGKSATNRDAKYYTLTRAGRRQLEEETAEWSRISRAMSLALRTT